MIFKDAFQPKSSYASKQTKSGNLEYSKQNLGLFLGGQHQHMHLAGSLKFICGKGFCLTRFNDHSVLLP